MSAASVKEYTDRNWDGFFNSGEYVKFANSMQGLTATKKFMNPRTLATSPAACLAAASMRHLKIFKSKSKTQAWCLSEWLPSGWGSI